MTASRLSQPPRTPPQCFSISSRKVNAHFLFDIAGLVHMARNAEQLGADIVGAADGIEPGGATAQDCAADGDGFHIVDGGRRAIEADVGREWRLHAGLALLAFEAFEQGGFFAADIGAGAMVHVEIEIPAMDIVLADEAGLIGLVDGGLQVFALADEFAAHIDVADVAGHGRAGNQAAFDQQMRIMAHDLAVLAGAGFGLVGIDDEIVRAARPPPWA